MKRLRGYHASPGAWVAEEAKFPRDKMFIALAGKLGALVSS